MVTFQVLLYHGIYRDREELPGTSSQEYVSDSDFARQVHWLVAGGYTLLSLARCRQRAEAGSLPEKTACITFDDGKESDLRLAAPILAGAGAEATFFLVPGWFGHPRMMVASDSLELARLGMEIGSHSLSHPFLTETGERALKEEVEGSKRFLEDLLGREVQSFSYPYGDLNGRVREAVRLAGYRIGCGIRRGRNVDPPDWLALKRWGIRETDGTQGLRRILRRESPFLGESAVDLVKRVVGTRRYMGWKARWLRRARM